MVYTVTVPNPVAYGWAYSPGRAPVLPTSPFGLRSRGLGAHAGEGWFGESANGGGGSLLPLLAVGTLLIGGGYLFLRRGM